MVNGNDAGLQSTSAQIAFLRTRIFFFGAAGAFTAGAGVAAVNLASCDAARWWGRMLPSEQIECRWFCFFIIGCVASRFWFLSQAAGGNWLAGT